MAACRCFWVLIGIVTTCLAAARAEGAPFKVLRDVTYVERESGSLKADVYLPEGKGPFPGILVVHGGAWATGSRQQLALVAEYFASQGYTAMAISYRLAPEHKFPAQLHDCIAAVRYFRGQASTYKIDPERIGGFGYSAGGHLVALLGAIDPEDGLDEDSVASDAPSARLQVVLAGGAPCDFRPIAVDNNMLTFWLGGTQRERPEAYRLASPASFATKDDPPMFFYHGEKDHLVPITSPQKMTEHLKSAGVTTELYTVPGAGHVQAIGDVEALKHAAEFAARYLKDEARGE
jgi:acetyl esterase/lipase